MRKNLYYYNWQLQETVFGVVLDDIAENYDNDEIYFVSCKGSLLPCWSNKTGIISNCELCRYNHKSAFSKKFSKVKQLYVDDYSNLEEVEIHFNQNNLGSYRNITEIKDLVFKNVNIGYGALSSYISSTRNRDPLIDVNFKTYFNKLLKSQVFLKLSIDRIIKEIGPDVITIFNGRIHDTRPVFQTALNMGIKLRGVETVIKGDLDYQRRVFVNALPHDIDFQTMSINEVWSNSTWPENEKIQLASSFYSKRRNNILARDVKVYTLEQEKGKLPHNWNHNKRNMAIFNSSEDEFAAIGKEWDNLALFPDQEAGIKFILENVKDPDIHFYLRIHPNLKDVDYSYHTKLHNLEKHYSNLTIIPASSTVSTYSLMDQVEKVVVFGSSTGAEASFIGKPTILLGGAFYYYLDVAYIPKSASEAVSYIVNEHLPAKPTLGASKYAFYLMYIDGYSKPIRYNAKPISFGSRIVGYYFPHLSFFGSSRLHKIVLLLIKAKHKILNFFIKPSILKIPVKEQNLI